MFKYLLLITLLFSELFSADTTYDQVLENDSYKEKAKVKLVDNGDDTYSLSVSGSSSEPKDYFIEVGKGNITGSKIITLAGVNDDISDSDVIYGDISQIPSVLALPIPDGIQLELISSDGNDTILGTGIQKVEIHYLDATTFNEATEIVEMNGTEAVETNGTNFGNIQWIHALEVGSNGTSAGNISLQNVGGGTIYEYIKQGGNQSLTARYTIPNAKKGYLINWHVSGMKKKIDFQLRATVDRDTRELVEGVFLFQDSESAEKANSGLLDGKGTRFPAKSTIKLSAKADGADGEGAGSFTLLIVDD